MFLDFILFLKFANTTREECGALVWYPASADHIISLTTGSGKTRSQVTSNYKQFKDWQWQKTRSRVPSNLK